MASVNKVILVGNLGRDPETNYTQSGSAVAKIAVATTDKWKDKQTGEPQERTEWHQVIFFNRLAEIAGEYLEKGKSVYIEGRLQTDKWQDKDGNDRYTTKIIASDMKMLFSKGDSQQQAQPAIQPQQQPQQRQQQPQYAQQQQPSQGFDDGIPF